MKSPPSDRALLESLSVWLRDLTNAQPGQSLFSLLLEVERRIRTETRRNSRLLQAEPREAVNGESHERQEIKNLSRYIE